MSGKGYRYERHTADVKFVAFGSTVQELFQNAALALFDTSADVGAVARSRAPRDSFKVRVSAHGDEELLWKTLQRLVSVSDIRGVFCYRLSRPEIREGDPTILSATAYCRERRSGLSKLEVKGVSKYELGISRTARGFRAVVVVDV